MNETTLIYVLLAIIILMIINQWRMTSILANNYANTNLAQGTILDSLFEYLIKVYSVKSIDFASAKLLLALKKLVKTATKTLEKVEIETVEEKDK